MASHKHRGREAWNKAMSATSGDDNLPVVTTGGMWTAQKLQYLCYYLEQFCTGMHGNRAFPDGLTYIDLFCGCGVSVVQEPGERPRRYPGSAVIAATLGPTKSFSRLVLVDEDRSNLNAAIARVQKAKYAGEVKPHWGDVNSIIDRVAADIPARSLNFAFIDPYSLSAHYKTIEKLSKARAMDLLVLFSDHVDLVRNVHQNYYPRKSLKLDLFLGEECDWRSHYNKMDDHSGSRLVELFADLYCSQLARLGYAHHKTWSLDGPKGPMFRLVFASKHPLGLKFCNIAGTEDIGGQRGLFG
ncbi:MAG TPA: three-Cys-motif partner protein TcmP [Phycisphaerales bacterium]|nr:three-Cys-motif partner protein TcmP [Phycisphaerales bacterium]